ncbi:MAG: 30S ribosomal protein S16 [Phycisphaerales bacterium]
MVKIRMSRIGRPHRPFYRISAVDSRVKRDGAVIEPLGWYDPMAKGAEKQLELKVDRIKHWIGVGAQPSETVTDLLIKNNIIDGAARKAEIAERIEAKKKAAEKVAAAAASKKDGEAKKA